MQYCRSCHQRSGAGDGNRYPPIVRSEWVRGDSSRLINVLLKGLQGPITVSGKEYNNVMPAFQFLNDQDLAELLTYVRKGFSNWRSGITPEQVAAERLKGQ
jgi:mono/diheme cytochrome c family protein